MIQLAGIVNYELLSYTSGNKTKIVSTIFTLCGPSDNMNHVKQGKTIDNLGTWYTVIMLTWQAVAR